MHPTTATLCSIKDGPLAYALSQMGKVKSDRSATRKDKYPYRSTSQIGGKVRFSRQRTYPEGIGRSRRNRIRGDRDEGMLNMDLLRGVYTLAQVSIL